jgi:hypothetical protein
LAVFGSTSSSFVANQSDANSWKVWVDLRRRRGIGPWRPPGPEVDVAQHGVQRLEQNVLVVSIDRLSPVLRSGVGGLGLPAELACADWSVIESISNERIA